MSALDLLVVWTCPSCGHTERGTLALTPETVEAIKRRVLASVAAGAVPELHQRTAARPRYQNIGRSRPEQNALRQRQEAYVRALLATGHERPSVRALVHRMHADGIPISQSTAARWLREVTV